MQSVGENLSSVIHGEKTELEHLMKSNMLDDYYRNGLGFPALNNWLAETVHRLVHRFPQMHILEFGKAGNLGGGVFSFYLLTII